MQKISRSIINLYFILLVLLVLITACSSGGASQSSVSGQTTLNSKGSILNDPRLINSIVGIAIPNELAVNQWNVTCSGTIINESWILTAGHCIANGKIGSGSFYPQLESLPIYVIAYKESGIPYNITASNFLQAEKYKVKAAYLPFDFNYYGQKVAESRGDSGIPLNQNIYIYNDFALLKLESKLPDRFIPLRIESNLNYKYSAMSFAGYPDNPNVYKLLNYRDPIYPENPWNAARYNESKIFTVGSVPRRNASGIIRAASYTNSGDDGGPVLHNINNQFSVFAIFSGHNRFVNPAKLWPESTPVIISGVANTSIPFYYESITAIINDTATPDSVRCISATGGCYKYLYVLTRNGIEIFNQNQSDGTIIKNHISNIQTGINPDWLTFDRTGNNLYVINQSGFGSGWDTISMYSSSGQALNPPQVPTYGYSSIYAQFSPSNQTMYVVNYSSNSVTGFGMSPEGMLRKKTILENIGNPLSISFAANQIGSYAYILSANPDNPGIFIYKRNSIDDSLSFLALTHLTFVPTSFIISPSGRYAYITNADDNLIATAQFVSDGTLNMGLPQTYMPSGGIGPVNTIFNPKASNFMYVINGISKNIAIFNVDPNNGSLSHPLNFIPNADDGGGTIGDLVFDPNGKYAYITLTDKNLLLAYTVDSATGMLTEIGGVGTGDVPTVVQFKP